MPNNKRVYFNWIDALGVMFIGLKITNNIEWDWIYVLIPLIFITIVRIIISLSK